MHRKNGKIKALFRWTLSGKNLMSWMTSTGKVQHVVYTWCLCQLRHSLII
jgi:hypothetical protein